MKIEAFELERWQSVWENRVELNIAESGVDPLSIRELIENPGDLTRTRRKTRLPADQWQRRVALAHRGALSRRES